MVGVVHVMEALNLRNNTHLAQCVERADTAFKRMRGLIGMKSLKEGSALLIESCNWVHTVGMRFPLDIVFLDARDEVVGVKENIPPNRFLLPVLRGRQVLELSAGTVSRTGTRVGDRIGLS